MGSQLIWEVLQREGVEVVFGYPGGAIMPTYDALNLYGVRHVLVRHEQGAAHMADGYARASGKVGVCIATSGPGATNLVTGIATALLDSTPLVCITGQVASSLIGTDAFQEIDITGITLPVTKHNYVAKRVEDIVPMLREAFFVARSGRPGPVLVDITKDAQQASLDFEWPENELRPRGFRAHRPVAPELLAKAAALIATAERPILFAGHGVTKAGASRQLRELAEEIDAPVASTLLGLGAFPASHPLSLGMMGMHGEAWVNTSIQQADLIIAMGMRFDDRVTGKLETYARGAKKIHLEHDPYEINKLVAVDVPLLGDLSETLDELLPLVRPKRHRAWREHIQRLKTEAADRDIQVMPAGDRLYAAHVIHDLCRLTEGKAIIVTDVGQHQMWEAQYYKHESPGQLITSGGLGTMGFALPAALGVRYARPNDEIWVVVGDGGFQMTACELTTCAQEGVKLNIAIINNGHLGLVRQWQEFFYDSRFTATPLKSPDFVKLADAHGLFATRVTQRREVDEAVARARATPGTAVIEFRVEQHDSVFPMVATNADLADMIRRPRPRS